LNLEPAPLEVTVALNSALVVEVVPQEGGVVHISGSGDNVVKVQLAGGEGVLLKLTIKPSFIVAANKMRPIRFNPTAPGLDSIRTSQYSFYDYAYKNRDYTQTDFIIGGSETTLQSGVDVEAKVGALAASGFNLLTVDAKVLGEALNAGLRQGVIVQLQPSAGGNSNGLSLPQIESSVEGYACHPNFGGWMLGIS